LSALRIIEDEATRGRGERILLRAGRDAAVYVLNKKRAELADIEQRYGVSIEIAIDEAFEGARMTVESSGPRPIAPERPAPPAMIHDEEDEPDAELAEAEDGDEDEEAEAEARGEEGDRPGRKRRRRRRGGRGRGRREDEPAVAGESEAAPEEAAEDESAAADEAAPEKGKRRRRRRGRKVGDATADEAAT